MVNNFFIELGKVSVQAGTSITDGDALADVTALALYVSTGAAGAVVSMVTGTTVSALTLPCGSVAVTLKFCKPPLAQT